MINQSELSFGQRIDPTNGFVECWFTHGALDEIKTWDMSDKSILMFGSGMGDRWLAARCKNICVIERKEEWFQKGISEKQIHSIENLQYIFRPCNDSSGQQDYYTEIPKDISFDIIINDDAYRTEICQVAVDYFKGREGILISDNWKQSFVWISPKAEEIMQSFESKIFEQIDHVDNDGVNKWKTAIHFIK